MNSGLDEPQATEPTDVVPIDLEPDRDTLRQ
jgi:hypothetical protein